MAKITKRTVDALVAHERDRVVWDGDLKGFGVRVHPTGRKVYIRHISDQVAVMYLGKIMERAPRDRLYESPKHPYTRALLSSVPTPNPEVERTRERIVLTGDLPSPANPPQGCSFRARCPLATDVCRVVDPESRQMVDGHHVARHHAA